uniref:Uncharacterized protein n=1 Tax=Morchella brunnea TaxID=1174671 RepID=A0A8K1I5K5_9PEZI|nr:hypothetical protein LK370_mgp019 [Morchella brunnea]UBU98465.1 hypothetical protein [Morchella brunnea]
MHFLAPLAPPPSATPCHPDQGGVRKWRLGTLRLFRESLGAPPPAYKDCMRPRRGCYLIHCMASSAAHHPRYRIGYGCTTLLAGIGSVLASNEGPPFRTTLSQFLLREVFYFFF